MKQTEYCKKLCGKDMSKDDANNFIWMIERKYKVNWYDKIKYFFS